MITARPQMDARFLVVNAADARCQQTREHILLASRSACVDGCLS